MTTSDDDFAVVVLEADGVDELGRHVRIRRRGRAELGRLRRVRHLLEAAHVLPDPLCNVRTNTRRARDAASQYTTLNMYAQKPLANIAIKELDFSKFRFESKCEICLARPNTT